MRRIHPHGPVRPVEGDRHRRRHEDDAVGIGHKGGNQDGLALIRHPFRLPFDAVRSLGSRADVMIELALDQLIVPLAELVTLTRNRNVPLWTDLPSGTLCDLSRYGLTNLPQVSAIVQGGADLVFFPGEQLVGGPECGIIVGKHALLQRIRQHALGSAVLASKTTLAALGATLELYSTAEIAEQKIPLLTLIATSVENLQNRAERLAPQLAASGRVALAVAVADNISLRGTEMPGQQLPTWCVEITPKSGTVEQLAAALRAGTPAVIGRIVNDRLRIDLRSVFPRQDIQIAAAFGVLAPVPTTPESCET